MGGYEEDGDGGFHIWCQNANVRWWLGDQPVTPGQSYAMSIQYKLNSGSAPIQFQYSYRNTDNTATVIYASSVATQTMREEDGWTILSDVLTVPDNADIAFVRIGVRTGSDYALYTCDYNIRRPQFETGNRPTDWSPAPEDTEAEIGAVRQAVMEITPEYIVQQVMESDEYTEDMAEIRTAADEIKLTVDSRRVGGTNLISCAEGSIWVKTGDVSYEWEKNSYHNRSGTGVWMTAWSDSHNEIRFNTNIHVQPGEYTLSFYSWCTDLTTSIRIRPNLLGNGADLYFDNQAFMPASETPTRHVIPLDVNHTGDVILRFVTMTPWTAGSVYFSDVKLESGNMATDWSPAPEDVEAAIGDVRQAVMEITPEYIVQKVTESSEYNEDMAEIRTTAQEIQLSVEGMQVGGTNLVSLAEGKVYFWPEDSTINREFGKKSHCQSGVAYLMGTPTTSVGYNCLYFNCGLKVAPGEYTLSFYSWADVEGATAVIGCNLNGGGHDHYFGNVVVSALTPTRKVVTFSVDYEATVVLRLLTWSTFSGNINITDVKLETGNMATAWSPYPGDPAEGLNTGTSGGVQVTITKDKFEVDVPGEDGDLVLNEAGGRIYSLQAKRVRADNLAYSYDGPGVITVNPGASDTDIAAGGVYRSLPEVFERLSNCILPNDLTINILGDSYGFRELYGVSGAPNGITINGNEHALLGRFRASNCTTNIIINDLTFVYDPASGKDYVASVDNCSHVEMNRCIVNGNDQAARGIWFAWGAKAALNDCEFYRVTDSAIKAGDNVDLLVMRAKGNVRYYLWANGATIKWGGTRPNGLYYEDVPSICTDLTNLSVDYGSAAPEITTPVTAEYSMQHADTYAKGFENSWNYQSHNDIMQGYTEHAGEIYGCIWFDNATIRAALSGKAIKQATLRLTAQTYVGRGVAVEVQLRGITTEYGSSGAPVLPDGYNYGVIGTATPGETVTITIPTRAVTDLVKGTINGFTLYNGEMTLYGSRNYSRNYMRFDGDTSGSASTKPMLTVTYQ